MSDRTPLDRLKPLQDEIRGQNGMWNADALRYSTGKALEIVTPGGQPSMLEHLAGDYQKAAQLVDEALMVVNAVRRRQLPTVWAGDTHVAAGQALAAAERGLERGVSTLEKVANGLRGLAGTLKDADRTDRAGIANVRQSFDLTGEITVGFIPDPVNYDGDKMYRAHHLAMDGMAERVAAHSKVSAASRELSSLFNDLASQARLNRLADSPLSAVDELLLSDAGSSADSMDNAILTANMADRAADRLTGLSTAERARMEALLADAKSPEQRAYLMRALAAGYDLDKITEFNQLIGPHGNDPAWLREHLSPLRTSNLVIANRREDTLFDGAEWTQGQYPTCVASSTVTARAQVDPLYALQLTTGGHPGDPAYDNGAAFAQRLRDEQVRVYDGGRPWYMEVPVLDQWTGGMTDGQSETIADEEIGARTGADYQNRSVDSTEDRRAVLPEIERAVDGGDPVPFSSKEGTSGHQMLIIGHEGNMLQIYNPWGYTVWVSEEDFVNGNLGVIQQGVPATPESVRLPHR